MPTLILFRYRAFDPIRRRWYVTPHMPEEEAAQRLNQPERIESSREERQIPDDPWANCTSAFVHGKG